MATNYPAGLDTYPPYDGTTQVLSAHQNDRGDAIEALEAKVGIDGSAVATSLDWLVKNAASINPGHKHTLAGLSLSGLTAGHALFASSATAASFRAIQEADIADGAIFARLAGTETIAGTWTFTAKPACSAGIELKGAGSESVTHVAVVGAGTVSYAWPSGFTPGQYLQVGAGGALSWATVAGGGGGGWQDDGAVIRPAALADQVAVGTSSPVAAARFQVSAQGASDILAVLKHAASPSASFLQVRRSDDSLALDLTSAGALKLKDTQALVLQPTATNSYLSYSNASSGYLVIECDVEGSLLTGAHCAAKFFSDTTVFFGDIAKTQGASGGQVTVVPRSTSTAAMVLRGRSGQTNDLLVFQNATPANLGTVSAAGLLSMPNITVTAGGALKLNGATSGFIGLMAPASAGSTTYTLPATDGSSGQVLTTNAAGILTWTDKAGGVGGSSALSAITAATAGNSISNGTFTQTWQWALGATTNVGFTVAESAAASSASTLLRVLGITGSTATLFSVVHPDTNAQAFNVDGGVARIKTKYLSIGPTAPWVTTAGQGVFDALLRWSGTFAPNPAGYASAMRVAAFTSSDLKYQVPTNPVTNMGQQVVFYGLHCGFEAGGVWSSSYGGYSLFGVDATLDIGQNVPDFHTMVAVLGEVNWNYADTAASNMAACFTASINGWLSGTRNSKMAAFWLRPSSGNIYTNEFALPSNKTMYGLLFPPVAVVSPVSPTRWRPIYAQGTGGTSFHGPRIEFGQEGMDTALLFDGSSSTTYGAAVTIGANISRIVSTQDDDKWILALVGGSIGEGLSVARAAFYRLGGMRLVATASAPESVLGVLYVNSGDSNLYYHNGSSFVNLSGGGGGGGGWQDDGTTIRPVTTSDKVVIGATSDASGVANRLAVYAVSASDDILGLRGASSQSGDYMRCKSSTGQTIFRIQSDGAIIARGQHQFQDSNGVGRVEIVPDAVNGVVNIAIGDVAANIVGSSLRNGLAIKAGQAPTTSPADAVQLYAKDAAAGRCWPAFKAEDGIERFVVGVESRNTSLSTGVGSIKLAGTTSRDNTGWLKMHDETGAVQYVPYFNNIN